MWVGERKAWHVHVCAHVCINPEEIAFPCLTVYVYIAMVLYNIIIICSIQYASLWASACMCVALQTYTCIHDLQ